MDNCMRELGADIDVRLLAVDLVEELLLLLAKGRHLAASWQRQALPVNLLLLLADDIHRHQHVQRVVHAPPDVLLVELPAGARRLRV